MRKSTLALAVATAAMLWLSACKNPFTSSGLIYNDLQEYKKAEAAFRRALEDNPKDAEALFNLGITMSARARIDVQNSTKSDAELAKQFKIRPTDAAGFRAAAFDSAKVKSAEATKLYRQAAAIDSVEYAKLAADNIQSNYSHAFNTAVKYKDQELWDDASRFFDLAFAVDPTGEHGIRARVPIVQLQLASAKDELKAAQLNNDDAAKVKAEGRVSQAITILDQIIPLAPDDKAKRALLDNKIQALRLIGRNDEAMAIKENLLKEHPDDLELLYELANDRMASDKFDEAVALFKRAVDVLEKDPSKNTNNQFDGLYYSLGFAYYRLANDKDKGGPQYYEMAIPAFERALVLSKDKDERADVLERLAFCAFELEHWDQAIQYAKQVTDLAPNNERGWRILCLSYGRNKQDDLAKAPCAQYEQLKANPGS